MRAIAAIVRCEMRLLRYIPWFLIGGLMILHGIAHSPAILGSWNLLSIDDVTRQPNVWLTNVSDGMLFILGAIWFAAALSFVIAGIGVLRQAAWWPMAAALALVLSIPMTLLWRHDAFIGLTLNAILLGVLAALYLVGVRQEGEFA
jgi:hypothetical protein